MILRHTTKYDRSVRMNKSNVLVPCPQGRGKLERQRVHHKDGMDALGQEQQYHTHQFIQLSRSRIPGGQVWEC